MNVAPWCWPEDVLAFKENEFKAGDVVTFDQYVGFPGELFTRDLRNPTIYVETSPDRLVERIKATGARFSVVTVGAAPLLQQAGAVPRKLVNQQHWIMEWKAP
jgi:hypothetical protein